MYKYNPYQKIVPDPADLSLQESAEIEQLIGTKLRMAQYIFYQTNITEFLLGEQMPRFLQNKK